MKALIVVGAGVLASFSVCPASAAEIEDMLGKWEWQKFTIEVTECPSKRLCAKVIAGPKNVGMEIFASDLTSMDGVWFGQIVSPETGTTYNTRMQFTDAKTWRLDGCTASKICLSGEFVRSVRS
jgi:uncharacterized protein (DUF2147 family)